MHTIRKMWPASPIIDFSADFPDTIETLFFLFFFSFVPCPSRSPLRVDESLAQSCERPTLFGDGSEAHATLGFPARLAEPSVIGDRTFQNYYKLNHGFRLALYIIRSWYRCVVVLTWWGQSHRKFPGVVAATAPVPQTSGYSEPTTDIFFGVHSGEPFCLNKG